MEIVGRKNLELTKRALLSHLVYCSHHSLRSPDKTAVEKWNPEIASTNKLLDAVEINLKREEVPEVSDGIENFDHFSLLKLSTRE
jgi:hypothetical protein